MFFKMQNIVQTIHLMILIGHPYLCEERIREGVTSFTLHREAGREIKSHMADQDLKLRKAVI